MGSLWAGLASAVICYAEYLGLGAILGPALLGYGDQQKTVGTLLVVLAASLACLCLALRGQPFLAGPRAASLSVLVLALVWLQTQYPSSAAAQLPLLAALMLGCATMLLISSQARVQQLFDRLPEWLVPSFIYASAVGITASATSKYLYSCLQVQEWQTWVIFAGATLLGVAWPHGCNRLAQRMAPGPFARVLQGLQGLALIVAAAAAWWAYEYSALPQAQGGQCARLGRIDLDAQVLVERLQGLSHLHLFSHTLQPLVLAIGWGLLVGVIVSIESRTALDALGKQPVTGTASRTFAPMASVLRSNACVAALSAPTTTVAASISQSRTLILWNLFRPTPWSVAVHGVGLLLVALLASRWLAWLPQLSLAVLMTLVATQMVGKPITKVWAQAYNPNVPITTGLRGGIGLWLVLALTALTGQGILGFVIPAIGFALLQLWRTWRLRQRQAAR